MPARPKAAEAAQKRRVPSQARSIARFTRILDAAEELFADIGYETASTEAIAERADTSIGSLYQFFPDKRAIFDELAERYREKTRAAFDVLFAPSGEADDWESVLDTIIAAFFQFALGDRGFHAVWVNGAWSRELLDAGDALNQEVAERAARLFAPVFPWVPPSKRALVATTVVEIVSAMLLLAARRRDPDLQKRLVVETQTTIRCYLRHYERRARQRAKKKQASP
jgi:AcrR family transcriptional regulator